MIRVWTPADRQEDGVSQRLHGLVEHVRSGESGAFAGADELVAFLWAHLKSELKEVEP